MSLSAEPDATLPGPRGAAAWARPEAPKLPRARLAGRDCLPAEVDATPSHGASVFTSAEWGVCVLGH